MPLANKPMRRTLLFTAPFTVEIEEAPLPTPADHELLVRTITTAVSPGTELLLYRGQMPTDMPVDATIAGMAQTVQYPLPYGYAAVGEVIDCGVAVDRAWLGRQVFAFQPHSSHFVMPADQAIPLPADVAPETAVFLPNMETAVSFVMDAQPMIGEQVAVFGQGIVGLLTTTLLAQFPLARLVTVDPLPLRRNWSLACGADVSLPPDAEAEIRAALQEKRPFAGADLTFELSGNPQALNQAIQVTGYSGRVLIGSWYGRKSAELHLGGQFHRSHMRLISSQVSHIAPQWNGRWSKTRRFDTAWHHLRQHRPERLITQRLPIEQAAEAFRRLAEAPADSIQLVFTYA